MIFKPRRSTSDDLAPGESDSKEIRSANPTTQQEADEGKTGNAMVGAFEALAQVVSREMDSVKHSIAEMEAKLTRHLDAEKQKLRSVVDELRQDMAKRVEALRQSQDQAVDGLRTRLEPTLEQTIKRSEEIRAGLEQMLAAKEQKLEQELQGLTRDLSGVRSDLEKQVSNSALVSNLLNNVAGVFSERGSLPEEPPKDSQPAHDRGSR